MSRPHRVQLCDVGPRDGFQYEERFIPTDLKVDTILALVEAGLPRIQVTSFVHPKWVPQMADAEEVVARLPQLDDVIFSGLVLNPRGMERACDAGLPAVDISIATWDEHSRDNANLSVGDALSQALDMVAVAKRAGLEAQIGLQTVFGFREPGDTPIERIVDMVSAFVDLDVDSISLADTTGMATPPMVAKRVAAVRNAVGTVPLVLHLHDTRGLGLANVYEAVRCGVDRFDTAVGGMGGCPFIRGAAGNVATEDTAYLLSVLGMETGVDIGRVVSCTRRITGYLEKDLPGKMYKLEI